MKEAKDYPVTDKYGATYSPWSPTKPHLGDDRSMPLRTPVKVNGVLIGYAGTTGNSSGVHTHTQKVAGGEVKNPNGGGFKVPEPVVVTQTGYTSEIGNYVRYRDGDGVDWSIFHFDEVTARKGDSLDKMEETYKELGYAEYKSDVEYIFGKSIPQNLKYKIGYIPKYQFWTPRKFLRSVARTQYKGKIQIKEDCKDSTPQYEEINETLYRRK